VTLSGRTTIDWVRYFVFQPLSVHSLPPHCPQAVWCHWGKIEPFPATRAPDELAECWSAREKSLEILGRGWELNPSQGADSEIHSFSHALSYHDWWVRFYYAGTRPKLSSLSKFLFEHYLCIQSFKGLSHSRWWTHLRSCVSHSWKGFTLYSLQWKWVSATLH